MCEGGKEKGKGGEREGGREGSWQCLKVLVR